jgi:hypothetical protein
MFDAASATASPRHAELYRRYEKIYTMVDFAAATSFVGGSVLFFFDTTFLTATWLFLIGSLFFAARPTVRLLREFHLARLPLPGDAPRLRPLDLAAGTRLPDALRERRAGHNDRRHSVRFPRLRPARAVRSPGR